MNPNEPVTQWRETVERLDAVRQTRDLTAAEQRLHDAATRRLRKAEKKGWSTDSFSPTAVVYDTAVPEPERKTVPEVAYSAGPTRSRPAPPRHVQVVRGGLPGLGQRR